MNKTVSFRKAMTLGLVALGSAIGTANAAAQISGTNAVSALGDNVTNATNVAWPLVIAIITALIALSVFLKVGRRGGVRA